MPARGTAPSLYDEVAAAAYATWQYNGHDVHGALHHASMHAQDPAVRSAAADAHIESVRMPLVAGAFESTFTARLRAERAAQA